MSKQQTYSSTQPYQAKLTRRESLKWLGAISATAAFPVLTGCEQNKVTDTPAIAGTKAHWPTAEVAPITAKGYGKDPNLIIPPKTAWPRTLTQPQLTLVAVMADIIVPREGDVPSASEVNVPDVVDEWLSSPYSWQQSDRRQILPLLMWLDTEAKQRANQLFVDLPQAQQLQIVDDIAYKKAYDDEQFELPAKAFARLRRLVLAAFFCTPEGTKDIGYMGNVAIAGDYPGPTKEAQAHLDQLLVELGLS